MSIEQFYLNRYIFYLIYKYDQKRMKLIDYLWSNDC